jgi:hypothetical protein
MKYPGLVEKDLRTLVKTSDQRRHARLGKSFEVKLHKEFPSVQGSLLEGITVNLSQGGAFIKTKDWRFFQPNESTNLTVVLPADFSGQDTAIGLQGPAIVRRVEPLREGIAVEFIDTLRQFRPTTT